MQGGGPCKGALEEPPVASNVHEGCALLVLPARRRYVVRASSWRSSRPKVSAPPRGSLPAR
eukprot:1598006-Pyramimonas_sp.AAC.1